MIVFIVRLVWHGTRMVSVKSFYYMFVEQVLCKSVAYECVIEAKHCLRLVRHGIHIVRNKNDGEVMLTIELCQKFVKGLLRFL